MPTATSIDFYFDFTSPYGYFAAMRIDALAARYGRTVNWHPLLLGAIFKVSGGAPLTAYPLKGSYALHDFERTARFHGIAYRHPTTFPLPTQHAARAMLWVTREHGAERGIEYAKAVFRALFEDGRDISQLDVIVDIGAAMGMDADQLRAGAAEQAIKDQLRQDVDDAIAGGIFGSPFVVVDGEAYWGFDRFDQIEAQLSASPGQRISYQDMIAEARRTVDSYPVSAAQTRLGAADVVFVDVRDVRELEREGMIPGAFHAPRGMLEFWIDPESPYFKPVFGEDKEFIFFCAAGWRSALAARTAQQLGLKRVADIEGGFGAWKAAGAPTEARAERSKA